MAESTSAIMWTTKKKARVNSSGQMAESMMGAGKMANNMALETIPQPVGNRNRESGKMAKDCIGYKLKNETIFNRNVFLF